MIKGFVIRPMRLDDLDEVMEIERAVFPMPWSLSSYRYELTQNDKGYYLVARLKGEKAEGLLLGYGGFWLVQDEAHICTLAVRPGWRRKGLGELILISLLDWAVALGANVATLEVRISNRPAQKLYSKYGFKIVGRRKRYYANQEDALIMTAYGLTSPPFQGMLRERRKEIRSKLSRLKEER